MKEFLRKWFFKEDVKRAEWFFTRKKDELERNYQDRANYLEMKYAVIERENKYLRDLICEQVSFSSGKPIIFNSTSGEKP